MFLFVPFYWLFSWLTGTYTLTLLQNLFILFGGLALYKLVLSKTSRRIYALLALFQYFTLYGRWASFCTACNLAIIAASMMPVFLYMYEKKKVVHTLLILVFLLITREDMALWTIFTGIFYVMVSNHDKLIRRLSWMVITISVIYFILVFTVFIPALETPFKKYHLFNYSALGSNPWESIKFIISHPLQSIKLLFINHSCESAYDNIKAEFYLVYLLYGGFMLFFRPAYILMFIPLILKKMYNDLPVRWSIESYYSIEFVSLLPIVVFLIISSLRNKYLRSVLVILVMINSVGITTYKLMEKGRVLNYDNTNFLFYKRSMYKANYNVRRLKKNLLRIPPKASVSLSGTLNPHLAFRPKPYYFPRVEDADFIAVLKNRDTWPLTPEESNREIKNYLSSAEWSINYEDSLLLILERIKVIPDI
jgi:uncharacterized membrane protein